MSQIESKLASLGLALPTPSVPQANYVPWVRTGGLVHIAGQVPFWNGELRFIGKLGREFGIEEGQEAARLCVLNMLAHLRNAVDGDLDRVVRSVRLGGFVNQVPEFTDQPKVINGASDLLGAVMGTAGQHARAAVGVAGLPFGVAVEIDGLFEVR